MMLAFFYPLFLFISGSLFANQSSDIGVFTIARLKYEGGGDWYSDPSSLPNLLKFVEENTRVRTADAPVQVKLLDQDLFSFPFLYLTGHGNISFSNEEIVRLRRYLESGGFLHADDNYGMNDSFRREMRKAFPQNEWAELPITHPLFKIHFSMQQGLPKIHRHDGKRPQLYGLHVDNRLVAVYSYESDLGDGWEDPLVHSVPFNKRVDALRMGTNIIVWALSR